MVESFSAVIVLIWTYLPRPLDFRVALRVKPVSPSPICGEVPAQPTASSRRPFVVSGAGPISPRPCEVKLTAGINSLTRRLNLRRSVDLLLQLHAMTALVVNHRQFGPTTYRLWS